MRAKTLRDKRGTTQDAVRDRVRFKLIGRSAEFIPRWLCIVKREIRGIHSALRDLSMMWSCTTREARFHADRHPFLSSRVGFRVIQSRQVVEHAFWHHEIAGDFLRFSSGLPSLFKDTVTFETVNVQNSSERGEYLMVSRENCPQAGTRGCACSNGEKSPDWKAAM
jgi:hypothetical protein